MARWKQWSKASDTAVDALIAWAHVGPAAARVDRVEASEAGGEYSGFEKWIG
jgi:hypothetical protein